MNFQQIINRRHSIREFEKKQISKEVLVKLIENACKAPSAGNRQPWIFYVVYSKKVMNQIIEYSKESSKKLKKQISKKSLKLQKISNEFHNTLGNAPAIIFIFRLKDKKEAKYIKPNDIASISCAVENLMLSAVEKKLGTCWIGSFKYPEMETKLVRLLKAPKNQELTASIVIGYPKKGYNPLIRSKKKLQEVLRFI